jgi:hypothetical protein
MRAVWQLTEGLQEIVWSAATGAVSAIAPIAIDAASLHEAIVDRSNRYTSEREHLSSPPNPNQDLAARALFFTVVDAPKVQIPLEQWAQSSGSQFIADDPFRVTDIGAGCGAMSLGLLDFWAKKSATRPLHLHLYEKDAAALRIAVATLTQAATFLGIECAITPSASDVTDGKFAACDMVLAGTVFNELAPPDRLPLAGKLIAATAEYAGHVVIVEPALRSTSRDLHGLRDLLVATGECEILAPCTHQRPACPALQNENDWCHEDRLTKLPSRIHELARVTGLRDGGLKFSYLLIASRSPLVADKEPSLVKLTTRAMSGSRAMKGQLQLPVCGPNGWQTLRLLRRHRNESNRSLSDAERGDIVRVGFDGDTSPIGGSERVDIVETTRVTIDTLSVTGNRDPVDD